MDSDGVNSVVAVGTVLNGAVSEGGGVAERESREFVKEAVSLEAGMLPAPKASELEAVEKRVVLGLKVPDRSPLLFVNGLPPGPEAVLVELTLPESVVSLAEEMGVDSAPEAKVELAPPKPVTPLVEETGENRPPDAAVELALSTPAAPLVEEMGETRAPEAAVELTPPTPVAPPVERRGENGAPEDGAKPDANVELAPPIPVSTRVEDIGEKLAPDGTIMPDEPVLLAPPFAPPTPDAAKPEANAVPKVLVITLGPGV